MEMSSRRVPYVCLTSVMSRRGQTCATGYIIRFFGPVYLSASRTTKAAICQLQTESLVGVVARQLPPEHVQSTS